VIQEMNVESEVEKWLKRRIKENQTRFPSMPKETAELEASIELAKRIDKLGITKALSDAP
jgi:hypothetical protein